MSSKIIEIKILNLEGPYNSFGNTFIDGIMFFFFHFLRSKYGLWHFMSLILQNNLD